VRWDGKPNHTHNASFQTTSYTFWVTDGVTKRRMAKHVTSRHDSTHTQCTQYDTDYRHRYPSINNAITETSDEPYKTILSNILACEIIWQCTHSHGTATKMYFDVTRKYTVSHGSKSNQTITGLIFANGEQQYTVRNFTCFNFLDTIWIIRFTRQRLQFYVSHSCKHNLHVTALQTNGLILCIPWMGSQSMHSILWHNW